MACWGLNRCSFLDCECRPPLFFFLFPPLFEDAVGLFVLFVVFNCLTLWDGLVVV
eukprot:m.126874 g.126874  ORF g.126874 m.126874 type:complete len:55 (+) comp52239_c0_seq5:337-501(+)